MTTTQVEKITKKQARKQISIIVFPLLLYSVCNLILQYGPLLFREKLEGIFPALDIEMVVMVLSIIISLFIAFVPVRISAAILQLDFKAYLKKAKLNIIRALALCCIGIAIWFSLTALVTSMYFMFHSLNQPYEFVGRFTTKANMIRNAVYFLCFVIIRPLTEEYIFRAVAQRQFGHYSRFFGVMASAFLYAMVQPTLAEAVPALFCGWFLALVTLRYHSIVPAMFIHVSMALFSWLIAVLPSRLFLVPTALIVLIYVVSIGVLASGAIRLNIVHPGRNESRLWKIFLRTVPVALCITVFLIGAVLSFFF